MSDAGRKDWSTQLKEGMIPDSSKSTQDQMRESFTDNVDKLARGAQPDSSKSWTQEAGDKANRMFEDSNDNEGFMDKVKNTFGMNK
ncbi:hypothetical protein ASPZODRAFT_11537 [Penicilliopsis zonata CBS 506.65]|uniref:Uncharacterized protein n=1 Tax=Penicilliopsis zonata CBS 506.65 TaxID=1073090 RepID=A0A1L9SU00_9EURO|nr:hypothetical protein ASPZODRAFT_11537 [Penicilliopsis zonata CBS 506.65]OJJ50678.1 hypothetical protein ASPZODRAFT_11537 [Penicilliopsis zonata CBS 506.65]